MKMWLGRACSGVGIAVLCLGPFAVPAIGQGLGGAGTVQGTVKDPTWCDSAQLLRNASVNVAVSVPPARPVIARLKLS